jgi:hypothetical protein
MQSCGGVAVAPHHVVFGRNAHKKRWRKHKPRTGVTTGKDCTRLIYLNSSAGQSEKDKGVLGTGKIGAIVGCVIGQHEANKAGARSDQKTSASSTKDGRV